ncbi:class I SAM-dependent methyltransferase [Bradyrhizobium sp. WD16]|uniref:class I SAM-dependent methyltransferase n=1 Tax=Bradyrhizobium sp. WD16 TaxID=1521768 RepID=UPI002111DD7E|nr:class I SAM-dependent methyltransferase [Bradyrhizobium sp. WD16]UTD28400.1 class I SAM-dependent methyltransferase [Bradyrhizobium sp. WD16]
MHPRYRATCRVCHSAKLTPVIDLGSQYLQGSFVKEGTLMPPTRKLPTQLVRCDVTRNEDGCGLLQLAHTFPPEILYANYWYRSGTNATMRDHLAGIVKSALSLIDKKAPVVLDVGCNDGTLLANYPAGSKRFGVDPSDIANGIEGDVTVVNTTFPSEQASSVLPEGGFDVVTSIAMFYDLEAPVEFASAVQKLLKPDGIWIFEMSYLPLMLLQNSFDTICHEHLEYYSLAVLETIAAKAGLRIFKVDLNDINGGSLRCYACNASEGRYGTAVDKSFIHQLRIREFELELDTDKPYLQFQDRINRARDELNALIFNIRARGERIHIYGASTKGNVLLQWYGINRLMVDCAADRNPQKVGSRTLGTDIPIVSEEESRAAKPDYYLVLPWHFRKEFLERERKTIEAGTKMIFPLPVVEVVGADNLDAAVAAASSQSTSIERILFE